jgi:hypothetical protein
LLARIVPHRSYGAGVSRPCDADVLRCRRRVAAATLLVSLARLLALDTLRHGPHRDSVTRAISLRPYCCGAVGQCGRASLLLCGAGGGLAVLELLLCIFCHCAVTCCFGCAAVDFLPRLPLSSNKERASLGAMIVGRRAKRHSLIAQQMQPVSVTLRASGCMDLTV